jgi:hypothetical protein
VTDPNRRTSANTSGAVPPARPAVDAERVAHAAEGVPTVARLSAGSLGVEVATYLPGRRVRGVRITDDHVEVHVVARWPAVLPEVADDVRAAVTPLAAGLPVEVRIDDLDVPGLDEPTEPAGELPPASPS